MCLAIPGVVVSCEGDSPLERTAKVNFGGVVKQVSLAFVPEAQVGDYVLVHVGFALSRLDQEEAERVLAELRAMDEDLSAELGPA